MPRLYLEEYRRALTGRSVTIACREGILRDHLKAIVDDIKFLDRQGIQTCLFHNLPNRFANQKHFRLLAERLPATAIHRVAADEDFYCQVLDAEQTTFKLIFLERKYLCDPKGRRINTLTPEDIDGRHSELIANVNIAGVLEQIKNRIQSGVYRRVHILPAGRNAIKHELFTVEGTGTLIAKDFQEEFVQVVSDDDVQMVAGILDLYRHKGYLRPRSKTYLALHRDRFHITKIDGIGVGCVECKPIDQETVELAALAISTRFRGQRVAVFTVESFSQDVRRRGIRRIISLTNNPRLQSLYRQMGFCQDKGSSAYAARQAQSPGVSLFIREL
jgi:amino-acid N-acetyltransferase